MGGQAGGAAGAAASATPYGAAINAAAGVAQAALGGGASSTSGSTSGGNVNNNILSAYNAAFSVGGKGTNQSNQQTPDIRNTTTTEIPSDQKTPGSLLAGSGATVYVVAGLAAVTIIAVTLIITRK